MKISNRLQQPDSESKLVLIALSSLTMMSMLIPSILFSIDAHADGILPADYPNAALINEGRELFFNETFDGNGRTCGSCHPEQNNFTVDPSFIAKLPADDPLFIAERVQPNPLSENFEKPELMHKLGLVLENTNGFDDLQNNFTMRSVPHLLAMRFSVTAPSVLANDGSSIPPDERTGWSGDGAPVDENVSPQLLGTLRDFATGAVRQHFTKSLNRQAGVDFRLPSGHELDAIEAFMLSLGRQQPAADITRYSMADEKAERGRLNYMGVGLASGVPCNACHFNGGANTDPNFDFPADITPAAFEQTNRSFMPRVEELLDQHADLVDEQSNPFDDGFGMGTNLFNVPPVIEAADTGPFFHNNAIATVEGMVAFYATQRHLKNGEVLPPIVGLNGAQVVNVAAFVRVLNADENARSAIELINNAKQLVNKKDKAVNLSLARSEIHDAIKVLKGADLHFIDAVPLFRSALLQVNVRRLDKAINSLQQARDAMIIHQN
jgi:cytochrome c peroxidase